MSKVGQVWQWVSDANVILLIVQEPRRNTIVTLNLITAVVEDSYDVFVEGPFWKRLT